MPETNDSPKFIESNYRFSPEPGKLLVEFSPSITAHDKIPVATALRHAAIAFKATGNRVELSNGEPYDPISEAFSPTDERTLFTQLTFVVDTAKARADFLLITGVDKGIFEIFSEQLGPVKPSTPGRGR